mmetsp:Transcript_7478/g.8636  ORF Transcript_7478/g.8636 Transcript_7478/m.8636 type:complete len:230 (+) Transcript_7478:537-1226(+)
MSATHASTNVEVVSDHFSLVVVEDENNAEIVCEQVDAVIPRHGHGHLELTRQELCAVDGFDRVVEVGTEGVVSTSLGHLGTLHLRGHELLTVQPHVVVRTCLRGEQIGNVVGSLFTLNILEVLDRRRRSHDVTVDVTTGPKGGSHSLNHRGKHGLQVTLHHAVKLVCLPSCQPQSPVPVLVSEIIHHQVKLVRHKPRRLPSTHHELIRFALAERALLTMVLLVATVKLH